MNKELKSLLILSLFTIPLGACGAVADGPGRASGVAPAPQTASMGEYAGPERTQAAMGHYAKARTLLVEAMREFDQGKEIARPDLILNSETWKAGVSARADELGHIISPQARETTGGTRFKEHHADLNENFDSTKKVASAVPARPAKKEHKQILVSAEKKESNFARARMTQDSDSLAVDKKETKTTKVVKESLEPVAPKEEAKEAAEAPPAKNTEDEKDLSELLAPPKSDKADVSADGDKIAEEKPKQEKASPAPSEEEQTTAAPRAEESETAKSINDDEIRARLKKLSEEIAQEEKSKK